MAQTFTLSQEQYEALIFLASEGTKLPNGSVDPEKARRLDEFLRSIEKANDITRSIVWVQWQELDTPLPPGIRFPETWPPNLRRKVELLSRPVARVDVDNVLKTYARNPLSILCSRDPAGILGYIPIEDFFA